MAHLYPSDYDGLLNPPPPPRWPLIKTRTALRRSLGNRTSVDCQFKPHPHSRHKQKSRKFKNYDVPTLLNKHSPDFCSVYVIAKGKAVSIRPASRPAANSATPPRLPSPRGFPLQLPLPHELSELEDRGRAQSLRGLERLMRTKNNSANLSLDIDILTRGPKNSINRNMIGDDGDFQAPGNNGSLDMTAQNLDFNNMAEKDMEAEMKRLKLELKQTMDMYNTACKEAVSAKKKPSVRRKKNRALNVLSNNDVRYRKYTIEEIEAATDKFSGSLKIGEGGYGPVYKGKLDHTPVAIKVLRPDAKQGRKQFQQEVEILSCIRHPNMVLLLGACPEYGCLVYEFMNYGSLEDRLFRKGNSPPIPWRNRFKIAADIATGLLFLHQTKPEPLVHRDLKPANILLDRNFVCKISDVGLARLVPPSVANSVTQYHMTSAAGTFCYIDPEYQQTGELGTKSDIYSLGVLLLQIITARPPMGLTHHIDRAIQKGTFAELLDPTVPDWPVEEAMQFAKLALKCCELRKKDRPELGLTIMRSSLD
ncbi:U-box domain-containing protein 34 [Camellia lanceoleosa]|uniref:U-box domain-containing protein 34 n=1 Tax=Camellia lanceoleosa TaxID=1840588 RepID=A0ACC0FIY5_9ERIC|nr:U-box domain-containing protein 34 [Camellia lanceoleosa]